MRIPAAIVVALLGNAAALAAVAFAMWEQASTMRMLLVLVRQ